MNVPAKTTPPAYKKLVADITRFYENARKAAAEVYWHTGRRIVEVEQDGAVRARYGEKLLENLSRDLCRRLGPGFSVENLRRMRRIYLSGPKRSAPAELTWTQQVELLPVKAVKRRARLEKKALREGLSSRRLRALVREKAGPADPKNLPVSDGRTPLVPLKGKMGIYRIVEIEKKLHWDRGFAAYRELSQDPARMFKDGDFVKSNEGRLEKVPGKLSDLYTYEADLLRAIDADTFWMRVWIARPDWRKEKLRLRGIDAPELNTPEGEAAKRFAEGLLNKAQSITVTTTKPDKYHRYLSDVFLRMPEGEEIFLNNLLITKGHAVRADKIPSSEWEKE